RRPRQGGELHPSGPDRRRTLPPDLGPARPGRVQETPGQRTHHPRPAPRRQPSTQCRPGRTAHRNPPQAGPLMQITVNVNGTDYTRIIEPRLLLIHFIRDELGLTGSHWGCDTSNCGACVLWLDEMPVKSCTVLAAMANGRRVFTVEGLARGARL